MAYSGAYRPERQPDPVPVPAAEKKRPPRDQEGLAGAMGALVHKIENLNMETDDLIMALILYLMYRESGDKDLLIMLGAMLLT